MSHLDRVKHIREIIAIRRAIDTPFEVYEAEMVPEADGRKKVRR